MVADTRVVITNVQTAVSDTQITTADTRTIVSDTQTTVANTQTMVADIHRNLLTGDKDVSGKNDSVGATRFIS